MKLFATVLLSLSLLLTVGCGKTSPSSSAKNGGSAVSPGSSDWDHNGNWGSPTKHGVAFTEASDHDRKSCVACHNGTTSVNGTAGAKCQTCHANIPHSDNWMDHSSHGKTYLTSSDAAKADCFKCHNTSNTKIGITCADCHLAYPHTEDFIKGGHGKFINSGAAAAVGQTSQCAECHFQAVIPDLPQYQGKLGCYAADCHPRPKK
mgnify:CR=1 FL=1